MATIPRPRADVSAGLLLLAALSACSPPKPPPEEGLAVHQSVAILDPGGRGERRLEVLEDARITPALRALMWGGSKDPAALLAQPGIDAAPSLGRSLAEQPFRRALLRLTDRNGTELAVRRLDCELGQIAEPALPQGDRVVWGIGDDCSSGEGDFAGLVTRFLVPDPARLRFESFDEPESAQRLELTLVSAVRIRWHLASPGTAVLIHEVSSHPDYDDARFKALKPDAPPPDDLPWVIDFLTWRWDPSGQWQRTMRTERNAAWADDQAWPAESRFPPPSTP